MNIREHILDSLIDDSEAISEIISYFKRFNPETKKKDIVDEINYMILDGLIFLCTDWENAYKEKPYSLTDKGKELWKAIIK